MTKILKDATSKDGKVLNTSDIKHLTNGKAESKGIVIIEKDTAVYLPNTQPNMQESLNNISSSLSEIVNLIDSLIDLLSTNVATNGSPIINSAILQTKLNPIKTNFNQIKQDVDNLKDNLI